MPGALAIIPTLLSSLAAGGVAGALGVGGVLGGLVNIAVGIGAPYHASLIGGRAE